jgi:selenocysteine lyase/cysteine desulfurase
VHDLISRDDAEYSPPGLPFEPLDPSSEFLLDRKNWTFLNHGAFGAALKCGYDRAQQWRLYLEEQPLRYFDRDLLPHLAYSIRRLATFCHADRQGLALTQNATNTLNTAISGYVQEYKNDAKIVLWDLSYGSVKKMARTYCQNVCEFPFRKSISQN